MTLKPKTKLSTSMTVTQFDNGYWYATALQDFAQRIGIRAASRLRKNELERAIKVFLQTGRIESPANRKPSTSGVRDVERGLTLDLPVVVYINDKETKDFLEREARRLDPTYKRRSGARYRINRWRDAQLTRGAHITYRDLVKEYVRLSRPETIHRRGQSGRYVNFLSDFMAARPTATMTAAIRAWKTVKKMDSPKNYRAFARR